MSTTVLPVATRAVLDACARLGLDPDAILTASGLTRAQIDDPDARISADHASAVWRHAYAQARVPDLALRAAEAVPPGAYKVIDFVVANAPTVGAGLERIVRYFPIIDPRVRLAVAAGDPFELSMMSELGEIPPPSQQYTLAAIVLRSRASTGVRWPLAAVELTFDPPADLTAYDAIFGAPIEFRRPRVCLRIPRASWDLPVTGANHALFSILEDHAGRLLAELPDRAPTFVESLRARLRAQLRGGDVAISAVAKAMAMSERTLQRRLDELGLSYSDVLDEIRQELGGQYLRAPDVSIAEVAWLLGFSDQSAFSRAFKRWTGHSPGAWRSAHAFSRAT